MYYFGYQRSVGLKVIAVKFDEDHAPSHRECFQKHPISEEEFKFATWGLLKQKYPQQQEAANAQSQSLLEGNA